MAFDEGLAERIRGVLGPDESVVEKKMFGGLAFMVSGHMAVGINGSDLMARVGADRYDDALAQPHAREMDFTGRSMKGFVFVGPDGTAEDGDLTRWVGWCVEHARSLPPK